jgi:hypothetical protein
MATARASGGNYTLEIEVYDPQYLAISWSNKNEKGESVAKQKFWTDPDSGVFYGLVHDMFTIGGNVNDIKYGFVKVI